MKILYLSLSYVPSRRASSVQVMKMCAALARRGHRLTLVTKLCAERMEPGVDDDHRFYGVDSSFEIDKLPRPAYRGGGLVFLRHVRRRLRRERPDLVYARDLTSAWLAARRGLPVVFEAHGPPAGALATRLTARLLRSPACRRLVVISEALRRLFEERGLLDGVASTVVAHDGADPPDDQRVTPAFAATAGELQVGYVGHLYAGRGVELILELAERLPGARFHLIGGAPADIERWRPRRRANVVFHGFVPPAALPSYYAALDLLLMPYERRVGVASGRTDTSAWMSPMKMFEYMASGRPMIAADLPVLREVLTPETNALLAGPGDVEAWTAAVRRLRDEPELGARLAHRARRDLADSYTWDRRAEVVLDGL